jgi:hypothetical protein
VPASAAPTRGRQMGKRKELAPSPLSERAFQYEADHHSALVPRQMLRDISSSVISVTSHPFSTAWAIASSACVISTPPPGQSAPPSDIAFA